MAGSEFSVSICVCGKDDYRQFDAALNSVVCQTVTPAEIVLTVDGEVPAAIERIIEKYRKELHNKSIAFKVIKLQENRGHGEARRVCFENCSYPLIAIMDADDLSVPTRFEKQIQYLYDNADISAVGGFITEFISAPDPIDTSLFVGRRIVPEKDGEIKKYMKKRCPMNQVTVMFRKDDVSQAGGYLDWYCEEDYYLWIRLSLIGKKFGNIPETLVNVRVNREAYQRRGGIKYFRSEAKLQGFMLKKKMIGFTRYFINVIERFFVQVLMPNRVRGWIFKKLARN